MFSYFLSIFQNHWGINSFNLALLVDFLHTIHKGMCEFAVCWVLKCLQLVAFIDSYYVNSLGRVDQYIKLFPTHHALVIFQKMQKFNAGISSIINNDNKKCAQLGSNSFTTGGFEAYKMPIIMFQLMFVLSRNDKFLPDKNSRQWLKDFSGNRVHDSEYCNIFQVVMEALQSAVDFIIVMTTECWSLNEI